MGSEPQSTTGGGIGGEPGTNNAANRNTPSDTSNAPESFASQESLHEHGREPGMNRLGAIPRTLERER